MRTPLLLLLTCIAAGGCVRATPWTSPKRLPGDTRLVAIPELRQKGNRCGPNALAMALQAAGDRITEPAIASAVVNPRMDRTLSIDLVLFARRRGYPATFERGTLERVLQLLDRGHTPILLLNLQAVNPSLLTGPPLWHYVPVFGFTRAKRSVLVQSGIGARRISFGTLERMWKPAGYWLMDLGVPSVNTVKHDMTEDR